MSATVSFEVLGVPKPQGSMKAFNAGGHARMKPSGGAAFAAWRNAVAQAAHDVAAHNDVNSPLDGPLALAVEFRFPMPSSRPKRDRQAGTCWKTTAPDTDKLIRTIGDALTAAALITDDARFVDVRATKVETTGWTGAVITVETATRDPRPATRDPRPATRDPRPATRDPRPATRDPRPATPCLNNSNSHPSSTTGAPQHRKATP